MKLWIDENGKDIWKWCMNNHADHSRHRCGYVCTFSFRWRSCKSANLLKVIHCSMGPCRCSQSTTIRYTACLTLPSVITSENIEEMVWEWGDCMWMRLTQTHYDQVLWLQEKETVLCIVPHQLLASKNQNVYIQTNRHRQTDRRIDIDT